MRNFIRFLGLFALALLVLIQNPESVFSVPVGRNVEYQPPNRNVGFGVIDPAARLEINGQIMITGGNPEADAVLTSDSNGLASWKKVSLSSIDNDLVINGAVSADKFIGNGAELTGINVQNVDNATTANTADFATSAGSATSAVSATTATNISPGGIINGAVLLHNSLNGTLTVLSNGLIDGDLIVNGELTANKFIGDGSMLTGLSAANVENASTANVADFATSAGSAGSAATATTATNLSGGTITNAISAQINGTVQGKIFAYGETTDAVTAIAGVTAASSYLRIQGDGGPVNITKNPQISPGLVAGQVLIIRGLSDTNTVTFEDGDGLVLDGSASFTLGNQDTLTFVYDSIDSIWIETGRIDR